MTDDVTGLPPAGHERDEELKRRTDALEEEADKREVHSMNEQALEVDREIRYAIEGDVLDVTNKQPGYAYMWIYVGQYQREITRVKAQGGEVVQGNDPEAAELKAEDTTRRIGDCVLMRMRLDIYRKWEMQQEHKRMRQQEGVEAEARDLASRYAGSGIKLVEGYAPSEAHRQAVRGVAMNSVDKMLREGRVPGMPVRGGER